MFGEMVGAALADCWTARRGAGRRRLRRAWPGPRDAWRPMRCGCCAARASTARCISSRPAPSCVEAQAQRCPTRTGMNRSATFPTGPCCWSPTSSSTRLPVRQLVGGDRTPGLCRSRRARVRPRRRDPRGFAGARRSGRGDRGTNRRSRRRRADHRLRPRAKRARRHAAGGARPPLLAACSTPGEQDLTAHVDFEAVAHGRDRRAAPR